MVKSLMVLPDEVRRRGELTLKPIPINQYQQTLQQALQVHEGDDLVRIHRDMTIIRAFENMLFEVSLHGNYRGVEYRHLGPAHLSIGQEAAAVGQAYLLGVDDLIFGGHRSHGEILAKGLSAIAKLSEDELMRIMENYFDGQCLRVVEKDAVGGVRDVAINFLLYGVLAEIFHRETGVNRGMGGSMHAFFPPFGIYPNNAIVAGSADIAVGAALFNRVNRCGGLVVCNIGDGATACGPLWESLCLGNMEQFKTLWDEEHRGGLPLIVNVMNNFYAMGGQTAGETMGQGIAARIGAAVNPDQMHAERIDGYNPLAVIDAMARKKEIIARGDGPVLLDTITYRVCGHSPSDASTYREKEEIDAWKQVDPIITYGNDLIGASLTTQKDIDRQAQSIEELLFAVYKKAIDLDISPRSDLDKVGSLRERTLFSNGRVESLDPARKPEVLMPRDQNPRVQQLAQRSRSAYDENGNLLNKTRCIQVRDALFEAILDRFYVDPTLIAYGEDHRDWGGAFGVYRGMTESLPYHRFFSSPIAEGAIVGSAVGYALRGGRAVVELMYCDFLGRCGDEVFNQLAKWQSMSAGLLRMPVVVRLMVGSRYGAQHSQDWSSLCAHIPGLKVVFPATPYDVKGLMNSALVGTDPVIFFENQRLYDVAEQFVKTGVPEGFYEIPFGEPDIKKTGRDLTIFTVGGTLYRALEAAEILETQYKVSCEVIDARSIVPFNYDKVIQSVKKTHRIVLTSDACDRGSIMQTFAAKINQFAFDHLDAPPVVVGARNWIAPSYEGEDKFLPFPDDIIDAVHQHIMPLSGYQIKRPCDNTEQMRRYVSGV